ncbi:prepilin-type N-terminal cleavage/methylation domain-containing protein [Cellulomonas taurus]|uniref:prepilin-type N-terminal cleavage/methylation domain-containing protein n=1 Tax=Cellulomonas taurus TaxID=2729175 RepID=UPI00145D6E67|nr:prepilin-type N-terminal cleavage/methylation domain-containing protein [Cellulomonas taurus]
MLRRINERIDSDRESGFSLIELLVAIIIIGILSAIAIPMFMSQRQKAVDTAAKSDVSTLGKEIATVFVDSQPTKITITGSQGGHYSMTATGTGVTDQDLGAVSDGVAVQNVVTIPAGGTLSRDNWCVWVHAENGQNKNWQYSATGGLKQGKCQDVAGDTSTNINN